MNKHRRIDLSKIPPGVDPIKVEGRFDGGIILDRSVRDLQPNQSPNLNAVRLEKGGLRVEFGKTAMSTAPASDILALGEHRFVDSTNVVFAKIFRLYQNAALKAKIDSWDGVSAWTNEHDSATIPLADVLVDWKSLFNIAFFADGINVFKWDRSNLVDNQGDDFTSANELVLKDDEVSATITPAVGVGDKYNIHYSVGITGPGTGSFKLIATHDGYKIGEKTYNVTENIDPARSETLAHEIIEAVRPGIANNDVIKLVIEEITRDPVKVVPISAFMTIAGGANPDYVYDKGHNRIPRSESSLIPGLPIYTFSLDLTVPATPTLPTLEFYFFDATGATWELVDSPFFFSMSPGHYTWELGVDTNLYPNVTKVGVSISAASLAEGWAWATAPAIYFDDSYGISIHGFNLATDVDPSAGVTYLSAGATQGNTLDFVYEDEAQGKILRARYLGIIADRLMALQVDGDPQKYALSANGNTKVWTGDGTDIGILDGESDPVDALMALEKLSSNVSALFRQRSIMRAVPTGKLNPPVAFFDWVEGLGTESPFSIARTPWGIMFLGHDGQVYLLQEGGPLATGWYVTESMEIDDLSIVEGVYDAAENEYILSVPE
jgi:hypothetical protein